MNKRLFPFLFLLSLFAFASLPAYQSCRVEAVTVSTDTNRKEVSKCANQRGPITESKGWLETLYERNGGRTLTFHVTAEDLQLAKKIDNLKLKW